MSARAAAAPVPAGTVGYLGWGVANGAVRDLLAAGAPGVPAPAGPASVYAPGGGSLPDDMQAAPSVEAVLQRHGTIFVDLAPGEWEHLLPVVRLAISDRNLLVLAGAGMSLAAALHHLHERKLVRCLLIPFSDPAEATVAYTATPYVSGGELAAFRAIFGHVRNLIHIADETRFDVARGLAGVAPAAFHTMVDALGDGALMAGMPRAEALPLLAAVLLAAARESETGTATPAQLREAALSVEGAAAGVMELESAGLRGLLMRAVEQAVRQARSAEAPPRAPLITPASTQKED